MNSVLSTAASTCVLWAVSAAAVPAQPAAPGPLPIRKIVLYKHGVGYFEREGPVNGDATIPLAFKSAQMKDVLKSLYAVDLDGGRITTILYDSKDPIQKQLEDILFQVPENSALTQFLTQLKGARVRADVGARRVEGRVMGIEPVRTETAHGIATRFKLVILRDDGAIEPVELLDTSEIAILDETVRQDLARMMDVYAKARYADRKTVELRAEGEGARRVRVGYIVETPIWKTSYRLLLDGERAPRLQGWAIVENRTDEDWNDVRLSFVAGSPLSFVLDLYTSYYPERPVLDMGLAAADQGVDPRAQEQARGRTRFRAAAPRAEKQAQADEFFVAERLGELLESSMPAAARGVQVGDLFAYEAEDPVSVRKGQAALVPILFEETTGSERILYYRRDVSQHPSHALRLANSTELTLEKGPVTVFEGSTCLGEAMLQRTLRPGMHEVLPYALETGVEIEPKSEGHARPVTRGVLANGVLTLVHTQVLETRYALRNKTDQDYAVYLDHPKAGGTYELRAPEEPAEQLPAHYRLRAEVRKGGEAAVVVREEQQVQTQVAIQNQDTDRIRFYARQTYLSEAASAMLAKVAGWLEQRAAADRRIQALGEERARLSGDQENLRENIKVLGDSPQERRLRDQYVERLTQAMARVDEIDAALREAQQTRREIDEQLSRELSGFRDR